MASKRKGKSSTYNRPSPPGRNGSLFSSEDVFIPEEFDGGGDSVPKEAYLVLKRAFDDVTKQKKKLLGKNTFLVKQLKDYENKFEIIEKERQNEREILEEKVGLGFKAFDEKYKDYENIKKELQATKEEMNKQAEDRDKKQQDLAIQKEDTATQTNTEENETADSCTQIPEEKTDEVGCVPPSTQTKLLRNCGLEIVQQNEEFYLFLVDRDLLRQWLENETDGKVSVAFEKTPVCERFVQTVQVFGYDTTKMTKEMQCEECLENEAIIIRLKNKIVDQANSLKRYREQQAYMAGLLTNTETKKGLTSSVATQTEGKFYDEHFMNKQVKLLSKYKKTVSKSMHVLEQKLVQLNKELDYQNKFSNRLLVIISSTMDVPENFVSTVVKAIHSNSGKIEKGKKPPVPRAHVGNESLESFKVFSPPHSYHDDHSGPMLSMPVQETDRRLRVKISKPRDPDYDPELDEEAAAVAPAESRSLTSESSASIVPADEAQQALVDDNIASGTGARDVLPSSNTTTSTSGSSSSSGHRIEQAGAHDDSDEIAVIEENEPTGAAGNVSGAKECPICFILCMPGTSQREYEKHVMDHFVEFE